MSKPYMKIPYEYVLCIYRMYTSHVVFTSVQYTVCLYLVYLYHVSAPYAQFALSLLVRTVYVSRYTHNNNNMHSEMGDTAKANMW